MYFGVPQLNTLIYTTIYDSCKNSEIKSCAQNLEKDLNNLSQWSTNENLLFNEDKTKSILFSTSQLAQKHQLSDSTHTR